MKIEIVRFVSGPEKDQYAIRKKSLLETRYRDLKGDYWWKKDGENFKDCLSQDFEALRLIVDVPTEEVVVWP